MELNEILIKATQLGASDVHLKHGLMPVCRVNGRLSPIDKQGSRLTGEQIGLMASLLMTAEQKRKFSEDHDLDLGYALEGVGRFRVNVFKQRGSTGMVFRLIKNQIPTLDELRLPSVLQKIAAYDRGLVLITGVTGSGKSTTLASLVDYINNHRSLHILTIEDPIEYLMRDKRSIINQRELGLDTPSFAKAVRQALRQDPDVLVVGEMRDTETIQTALLAAETGHLVFSTLHTTDAKETLHRILGVFESNIQNQVRLQLASCLKAVVCQRLIPRSDGLGLVPAVEVMIVNQRLREMILDPKKIFDFKQAIEEGSDIYGMQSFDQSLIQLLKEKHITYEEARAAAASPDDFALRVKGVTSQDSMRWKNQQATPTQPLVENAAKLELQLSEDSLVSKKK